MASFGLISSRPFFVYLLLYSNVDSDPAGFVIDLLCTMDFDFVADDLLCMIRLADFVDWL